MSNQVLNPDSDKNFENDKGEWARCVYEAAQETVHHSDAVFYEVAAIVWSANTLLLGFILEVPLSPSKQKPVFGSAILGLLLTAYVPLILWLTKIGQGVAIDQCKEIEKKLPEWLQFHLRIDRAYPKRRGQYAAGFVTVAFTAVWIYILQRAWLAIWCGG
jgi:hypothetical protein